MSVTSVREGERERERVGFSGNGAPPFFFFGWRLNGIGGYGIL